MTAVMHSLVEMHGVNREEPFVVSLWSCSLKSFRPLKKLALLQCSASSETGSAFEAWRALGGGYSAGLKGMKSAYPFLSGILVVY